MNATQRGIITLLKSAVTEQALPLPEGFDLAQAYPIMKRHYMSTLIYDGAVRCGISRTEPVMQRLFQNYCRLLMISEQQMTEVHRIYSAFDENGIDYMPLKGSVMKERYPKPELRIMGDADILIRTEQYDRIIPVMEGLGFAFKMESDHELVWISDGLYLELHKRLIPSYNRDFHEYFSDSWARAGCVAGCRYAMTSEDELVYLFTHFAKHFRDGGIGCRHVVDLWVYLRSVPDLDEEYVRRELETLQLLKFYWHIRHMMEAWFGDGPDTEMSDFLTEAIFNSGSFGSSTARVLSSIVRDRKQNLLGFNGRLMYLFRTAFPSVDILKEKYTVLQKHPWLLPLVWVVRPFYKVLFERSTLQQKEQHLRALSEEQLDEHSRMLHALGLDYRF